MLRMLHFSDVHLDAPHTPADLERADIRRAELRAAFSSLILYIRQNDVRLALIAGDLFDNAFLSEETVSLLRREFASVPACHFVISPGNRDYFAPDSVYAGAGGVSFGANVHIFRSPRLSCFSLSDIGVEVYGFAHTAPTMDGYRPLDGVTLPPKTAGVLRFFCGHTALASEESADKRADASTENTDHSLLERNLSLESNLSLKSNLSLERNLSLESGGSPIVTRESLARLGFDYAALGHDHTSGGIRRIASSASRAAEGATALHKWTYFGYSGCLVGRGFDECGVRGAVCGVFDSDAHGETVFSVRRLRISRRHYETLTVDFDGSTIRTMADAYREIGRAALDARKQGVSFDADAILRVHLRGTLPAALLLTAKDVSFALRTALKSKDTQDGASSGFFSEEQLVMIDDTRLSGADTLSADPTLRGSFCRALSDSLHSDDPDMREIAEKALRAGLSALQ